MKETRQTKETWDEVLVDDRRKLGMDSVHVRTDLSGEGVLENDLSNKLNPRQRKTGFKMDDDDDDDNDDDDDDDDDNDDDDDDDDVSQD